tara:strand:- start:55 stop:2361 length:2307 start_codon:yes stop_codon:yes gene_type:complete
MAMNISRQIKLRSVEQAIFKPSYNRLNFMIQPDGLATDLSQSYLSMRVWLTKAVSGDRVSKQEMAALIAQNLCVSFGNNDQSYSPAAMIRICRLFDGNNNILEESNFSNVLTQSIMHQLCNDFESVESTNLLTGSSSQIGHGSSMPATMTAFLQNPTTVHIFLRDLFGICRHSNVELERMNGMQITLELEDRQNLFKITTLGDFQQINVADVSGNTANAVLPERFVNPASLGYLQSTNSMSTSCVPRGQFEAPSSGMFLDASGNYMIQYPKEGFEYPADVYFQQPTKGDAIAEILFNTGLQFSADQLTALGFVVGAFVKLRYEISSSYAGSDGIAPKPFYFMTVLTGVAGGADAGVQLSEQIWYDDIPGRTVDDVVTFMGLELLRPDEVVKIQFDGSQSQIQAQLASNTLTVTAAQTLQLKQLGVLDTEFRPTGVTFDLGVQMFSTAPLAAAGAHIIPDFISNQSSSAVRKVFSNQITKLPAQGDKCRILGSTLDTSGNGTLTFSSWGCEGRTSIQAQTFYPTGVQTAPHGFNAAAAAVYYFWNIQNHARAPNDVDLSGNPIAHFWNNLSYEIDKFELVLIQSSIDPRNRMPTPFIYSTWKVETANIEVEQQTWARQFILEQGVYNCFTLTPNWNTLEDNKGSMISTRRGISHYRLLVNNIAQTNRDVYLQDFRSDYPSSLYIDRLKDTFSNSEYILRSPFGIKGVQETADPVTLLPLKIYHAITDTAYVMGGPGGATVQVNLYGDPSMDRKIKPGLVFFFKQLLKQI